MLKFVRRLATSPEKKQNLQDVVIVGGGPAGLTLLAALKSSPVTRHLSCTLIEGSSLDACREFNQSPPENYTNRIVSLTPKSIEFMQNKVGNWNHILQDRIKFYNNIIAYDSRSDGRINFDASATKYGVLAAMCENINIQGSLLARIDELNEQHGEAYDEIRIMDNVKVVDIQSPVLVKDGSLSEASSNLPNTSTKLNWPVIKLSNGEEISARLLVGADGYNSPVRNFSKIDSLGWNYDRFGVVAVIKLQYEDFRSIGWQRFLSSGPLAILPLTEDNATIVWSTTPELSKLLLEVHPDIFPKLVTAGMTLSEVELKYIFDMLHNDPKDMQVIDEIDWRISNLKTSELEQNYPIPVLSLVDKSRARFPLKMAHASTYTASRIALIGDAAHTIHPLAGQGLNMGQSDVSHLMDALEMATKRGLDIGSTMSLDPYTASAWPSNHVLLGACDKLHKVFGVQNEVFACLRSHGMNTLNSLGFIKDLMMKSVSGN